MAESDPSNYLTVGQLADLCTDWPAERLVWIDAGAGLHRVRQAGHLDPGGDGGGALTLRSYGVGEVPSQLAAQVWIVEWAAAWEAPIPRTTAHNSDVGARAHIAATAAELGVEVVEQDRPVGGIVMMRVGQSTAMLWSPLEVLP